MLPSVLEPKDLYSPGASWLGSSPPRVPRLSRLFLQIITSLPSSSILSILFLDFRLAPTVRSLFITLARYHLSLVPVSTSRHPDIPAPLKSAFETSIPGTDTPLHRRQPRGNVVTANNESLRPPSISGLTNTQGRIVAPESLNYIELHGHPSIELFAR